ncbi:cellulase-like family protein [Aestuariimicrobium ganziense]|uniref:cellulase-like family protein n=1 Tax=Aestuariimicrobium ganziense TaxID=2773677 RepID=UPI001941B6F1|nr:cellulase-like family protein [Aestuariimicrobium ganziense]
MTGTTTQRPERLPSRLTITLWDFSWFTQAGPGEPFHDLDEAMAQAVERGYNTVRICAMPHLLFGDDQLEWSRLRVSQMGPGVGHGTRWYNVAGGVELDGRERLRNLFEAARRHGVVVIISSWEYQQSPAFSADDAWYRSLMAVPPQERHLALARSLVRLVEHLTEHGLGDQIAYVELHNEVDLSRLRDVTGGDQDPYWSQKPHNEAAIEWLREQLPGVMVTTCYGITPYLDMDSAATNGDVAHFHIYVYGTLGALERWAGVRSLPPEYPTANLCSLLREDAPAFGPESTGHVPQWRYDATGVSPAMFYSYDQVDPRLWDRWLYEHHHLYAEAMRWAIADKLDAVARFAASHGIPAVIGEGWIGYTPLHSDYEDGPLGSAIAEFAVDRAIDLGYWGVVLGSNSAPHHPGWGNVGWQQRLNRLLLESAPS